MKKGLQLTSLALAGFLWMGAVCANRVDSLIEQAEFDLDHCNPADAASLTNCTSAVDKADDVQTTDAGNIEAAIIESSGRLGLAGFDFLQLAQSLSDLGNQAEDDFAEFRALVTDVEAENGREIDLDELTAAETPLDSALTGVTANDDNERAFFQLGIIQAVDAFIRPVKIAGEDAVNITGTTFDDNFDDIRANFLAADNNLVTSGTEEDDVLRPVRENYCRCSLNGGFTAACLRDLMRCELSDTAVPEQDYDGGGAAARADCATLVTPAGLDACGGTNTSL